jgi:hypothetical protein
MNNGVGVSAPANAPTTVTTNGSGYATVAFEATSPLFSTSHPNTIQVNVTDPLDSLVNVGLSIQFYLTSQASPAQLQLVLGQSTYYSGDSVTGTWTLGGVNDTLPAGWNAGWWEAYTNTGPFRQFAEGVAPAGHSTGTLTFSLPTDFTGQLNFYLQAENASETIYAIAYANVVSPTILVNPGEATYKAGDTFSVAVIPEGQAIASATLYEITTQNNGAVLSSGPISGGSFPVKIPTIAPPDNLEFTVFAQTSSLGVIAEATASSSLQRGFVFTVSVQTSSAYSDGSYQPGQTVTVSYSLTALGTTDLPSAIALIVVPAPLSGEGNPIPGEYELSSASTSGAFSYTIPANSPNGYNTFGVYAYPLNGGCQVGDTYCANGALLTVDVNSNPPALGFNIGSGTGLTLGWLILLIIIVAVVIVGIVWARKRMGGGGGRSKTEPAKPYDTSATTPPATNWNDASSTPPAGGSPPPPGGSS